MLGDDACQQHADKVDLVITDHAMPHMTGAELAMTITAHWPGVPIILATGSAELPSGPQPALPRLSKPYRQEALAEAVASAVGAG